ncbi:hypothetical protein F5148DRAFT_1161481 [Russula earlei]|uniref:Uncharacterized protein n=1 Tax=Russula earlei TaxID=71964 RepID=A0ACC0UNU8_9AGAM|nr:hypothetical protein F5148DRAFT_1161481 [Russula earlei]
MQSAIAAHKARLEQEILDKRSKSSPRGLLPLKTPTRRSHSPPPSVNPPTKRARKISRTSHAGKCHDITTTVTSVSKSFISRGEEEAVIPPDYSDDDSITLDQEHATLIPHQRPPEPTRRGRMKAWSPSRLAGVSSDDASDASEPPLTDLSQLFPHGRPLTSEEPEILSTYRPAYEQNLYRLSSDEGSTLGLSGPAVALILPPSATVSFVGVYRLRVLRGSVSLLGITIQPSPVLHNVFAPWGSPIPVIEAHVARGESSTSFYDIPARIMRSIGEGDVVVVLQDLRTGIEGLGRVVRIFEGVFDRKNNESVHDMPLEGIHMVSQVAHGSCAFQMPLSWEAAFSALPFLSADEAASIRKPHVLLVKGQKNSGKSTFARTLANKLCLRFRRVAFLECDIGQSEFTPGGMVALTVIEQPVFGPPFTHPTLPYQAHYVGAHNPRSSPSSYLRAIQALVEVYRLEIQFATSFVDIEDDEEVDRIADHIPLVVNTMGWTKGLGADLARRIEEFVQPSDIFSFDTFPIDNEAEPGAPLVHVLEPITLLRRFTPSDHRALSLLSYLHAVFPDPIPLRQTTASRWSTDLPLCTQPPYELTSLLALDRIVLVGAGAEDVVQTELPRVLAGALVALVSGPPSPEGCNKEELYTPGSPPPDPSSSNCYGLALVRGVSHDVSKLQLLTPVPTETLANARILVMGELQLPVWGWLDFRGVEGGVTGPSMDVPFLRWGRTAGAGGERRRIRRNIMRRAQM